MACTIEVRKNGVPQPGVYVYIPYLGIEKTNASGRISVNVALLSGDRLRMLVGPLYATEKGIPSGPSYLVPLWVPAIISSFDPFDNPPPGVMFQGTFAVKLLDGAVSVVEV